MSRAEFQLMNFRLGRMIALRGVVSRLRDASRLPPNRRILEIGCGNGVGTRLIYEHFSPSEMVAIDLDARLVRTARGNNSDLEIGFELGDATRIRFEDATFDAVVELNVMHHVPNWRAGLNEVKRVTRPGGEFIVKDLSIETFETLGGRIARKVVRHPYEAMFRREEFVDCLRGIGFEIPYCESFHSWHQNHYFLLVAENT